MNKNLKTNIVRFVAIILSLFISSCAFANAVKVSGSGSSIAEPAMLMWTKNYQRQTGNQVSYVATGSGAGVDNLEKGNRSFALTDMPYSQTILDEHHWVQFPMMVSMVDIVYNLPGITKPLTLNGPVIADMYLGKIVWWDNPAIKQLNPEVNLPHKKIVLMYRSTESGTTYAFSHYLSEVSDKWTSIHDGTLKLIDMPANSVGERLSSQLALSVKNVPYSIGYVSDRYAQNQHLAKAELVNHDGMTLSPSMLSAYAALVNIPESSQGMLTKVVNLPGTESWPILATTFMLVPEHTDNKATISSILKFCSWVLVSGNKETLNLGYIPVPHSFRVQIRELWQFSFPKVKLDYNTFF
ncbi:phosphate ABC transporter substrate-binding protein PstS [Vibrio marisflavi]|uniref:Phosphate-binding protein PstS n=1 Tax=Vibrio marisflavi CECT 7928 TaxID=634439 RepID=A0ABM8ZYV7_9VIBR|nr:phosphate ABC transporter substrate-binding protein PstS [Vibrio marisflavi]CAH0536133.1 Phosphate-binding protein PstS [Vibrio marisflavi CECT 7928]